MYAHARYYTSRRVQSCVGNDRTETWAVRILFALVALAIGFAVTASSASAAVPARHVQVVSVVRPNGQGIDLFMRGTNGQAYHAVTNNAGRIVVNWESIGGLVKGAPTAVWNSTTTRLDVFAVGVDFHPYHTYYQGGWAGVWNQLSGTAG